MIALNKGSTVTWSRGSGDGPFPLKRCQSSANCIQPRRSQERGRGYRPTTSISQKVPRHQSTQSTAAVNQVKPGNVTLFHSEFCTAVSRKERMLKKIYIYKNGNNVLQESLYAQLLKSSEGMLLVLFELAIYAVIRTSTHLYCILALYFY